MRRRRAHDRGGVVSSAARFVGFDLAADAIARGVATARAAGAQNVELLHRDVRDVRGCLQARSGPFDYVVAHGVYSWVPESIRSDVLAVVRVRAPAERRRLRERQRIAGMVVAARAPHLDARGRGRARRPRREGARGARAGGRAGGAGESRDGLRRPSSRRRPRSTARTCARRRRPMRRSAATCSTIYLQNATTRSASRS